MKNLLSILAMTLAFLVGWRIGEFYLRPSTDWRTPVTILCDTKFEDDAIGRINRNRTERRLDPLSKSERLCRDCREHSRCMARTGRFEHASGVNECIAHGQDGAVEVVDDWMHSAGHRRLILTARFRAVGIGRYGDYYTLRFE